MATVCVLPINQQTIPAPLKRQRSYSSPQIFRAYGSGRDVAVRLPSRAVIGRVRGATLTGGHRPFGQRSTTGSSVRHISGASPFSELPSELLVHILLFARTDRDTALALSLVSSTARRYALPILFSTRVLRTHDSAQIFLEHVANASGYTPIGSLVQALWLSDTGVWPAGLVRAIINACPNVEKLALTGFGRLLPTPPFTEFNAWAEEAVDAPLFGNSSAAQRPLKLTLVGHVDAMDLARLRALDPRTFSALTKRLRSLRMLQPRSLFHARLAYAVNAPTVDSEEHLGMPNCALAALLMSCPNIECVSVPLVQLARYIPPFGIDVGPPAEPHFSEELYALKTWLEAASTVTLALESIEVLVDPRGRLHAAAEGEPAQVVGDLTTDNIRLLEKRALEVDSRVSVIKWPRNVDAAREAWLAEDL